MWFKKVTKLLTYSSRKRRIEIKIFNKFVKKYPNLKLYDSSTGDFLFGGELIIKNIKHFDEHTGNLIKTECKRCLKIYLKIFGISPEYCPTMIATDISGNLLFSKSKNFGINEYLSPKFALYRMLYK